MQLVQLTSPLYALNRRASYGVHARPCRSSTPPAAAAAAFKRARRRIGGGIVAAAAPQQQQQPFPECRQHAHIADTLLKHISGAEAASPELAAHVHFLPCPRPPPEAWRRLEAAAAAGGLAAELLSPARFVLPEEGAGGCYLARRPWVRALRDPSLAAFLAALFRAAADGEGWRAAGLLLSGEPGSGDGDGQTASAAGYAAQERAAFVSSLTSMDGNSSSSSSSSSDSDSSSGTDSGSDDDDRASLDSCTTVRSTTSSSQYVRSGSKEPIEQEEREAAAAVSSSAAKGGVSRAPRLSRHDLFHGHLFLARPAARGGGDSGGASLGLLLHACEYPAFDAEHFPYDLGFCQRGSRLAFDARAMDCRNLVFFGGRLAALDVGAASPLHGALLHDGTRPFRTVYEEDLGAAVADVLFLPPAGGDGADGDGDAAVAAGRFSAASSLRQRDGDGEGALHFHFGRPIDCHDVFVSV